MLCVVYIPITLAAYRKRYVEGTRDKHCVGPVLKHTTAISSVLCADECFHDAQCVAYSQRAGSQCLLHADFCTSDDLLAEQGSLYRGGISHVVFDEFHLHTFSV